MNIQYSIQLILVVFKYHKFIQVLHFFFRVNQRPLGSRINLPNQVLFSRIYWLLVVKQTKRFKDVTRFAR